MPEDASHITVRDVSKTFGSGEDAVHALKDINLDINKHELLMIVGPSGCGKTTLLSIIAGTLSYDIGSVTVFGNDLHKLTSDEITLFRSKTVGFIFQQYHLIPTLTCVENVAVPLLLLNYPRKKAFEIAAKTLEKVGIGDKTWVLPKKLSGGQQQRVAVARALVHNPKLIICDEPTAALDAETGKKVMDLLLLLAQDENRSVIVVTHDHRIFKYADRVVEMDDGAIVQVTKNHVDRQ